MKKIKQINNWIIKHDEKDINEYKVFTPDGIFAKEFIYLHLAEEFCRENRDFVKNLIPKKLKGINDIDKLCDFINEKNGLKPREVGSLERVKDMTQNSIVKIGNEYGGYIPLYSGTDNELIEFLQGFLRGMN